MKCYKSDSQTDRLSPKSTTWTKSCMLPHLKIIEVVPTYYQCQLICRSCVLTYYKCQLICGLLTLIWKKRYTSTTPEPQSVCRNLAITSPNQECQIATNSAILQIYNTLAAPQAKSQITTIPSGCPRWAQARSNSCTEVAR